MCELVLDFLVVAGTVQIVLGRDAPDLVHLFFVSLGISVANLICLLVLGQFFGLLVLGPILIVDWLILMYFCGLPLKHAGIVLGVLLGYKVAFYTAFALLAW